MGSAPCESPYSSVAGLLTLTFYVDTTEPVDACLGS